MSEENAIDDFIFGGGKQPVSKEKYKNGDKLDISEALAFFERGGMSSAQMAMGLLCIAQSGKDLLVGGLTKETLYLLVQKRTGFVKGNLVATSTIEKVLDAVASLDEFVDREALAKVIAAQKKRRAP